MYVLGWLEHLFALFVFLPFLFLSLDFFFFALVFLHAILPKLAAQWSDNVKQGLHTEPKKKEIRRKKT